VAGVLDTGPVAPAVAAAERLHARLEASYCERVGVAPELVPPLRLLCWTIHAGSEHRRFELDAAGPPTRATLESSLFLELWRLELASLELS
jgi:hypothetical protein